MCTHRGNWINFELLRIKYLFAPGNLYTKIWMTGNRVGSERLIRSLSSHTTVRTVRYTAVPCFDTLLRVGCCFQLSIKLNHSCLFLRFRPTFLARSLLKSIWLIILKVTFIYYHTARFCPSTLRKTSCFFFQACNRVYYDFCWLLTAIVIRTFQHVCEISRGKTSNLHSMYRHHLHILIPFSLWDFILFSRLIHSMCLIMFVFLRSEICRRLPSDSTSRWTPLSWANGWQLIAPITDLHRQIYSPCSAH